MQSKKRLKVATFLATVLMPTIMALAVPASGMESSNAPANSEQVKTGDSALQGSVVMSRYVSPETMGQCLDELMEKAVRNDPNIEEIEKALSKHQTLRAAAVHKIKDSLNFAIFIRGNGPSAEAGDVILDENFKIRDRSSAEYAKQRLADKARLSVVTNVMQIAEGIGSSDQESASKQIHCAYNRLEKLVGTEAAQKMLNTLTNLNSIHVPERIYQQKPWGIGKTQAKVQKTIDAALKNDAVVADITNAVHRFNHRSKKYYVTTSVVKTALGIGALTPSIVGTACSLSEYAFIMATGGPEEDKIMKELYLDKRLQSHGNVLAEEAHMALYGYQIAKMTRNPALLLCSQSVLRHLVGKEEVPVLLEYTRTAHANKTPNTPVSSSVAHSRATPASEEKRLAAEKTQAISASQDVLPE